MAQNTSVALGPHFEKFVRRQIKSGRFGTRSEVIRAGLRLLEDDEVKLKALRDAIAGGDASGFDEHFSFEAILADAKRGR